MVDRKHFEYLDALRGIAAIAVVLYHLGHWRGISGVAANGYLAVDFFFCLSGFVVARAYGRYRAPTLVFRRFALARLIRLMPLIVLASLVAASYVFARLIVKPQQGSGGVLATALLLGSASIPNFHAPSWIGGPQVFPLNGPQYTLFLEILANLVWFVFRELVGLRGSIIIAVASFGLVWFGGLGGDTTGDFLSGFPRVATSFYAGVAVCYVRDRNPTLFSTTTAGIAFLVLSTLFMATLLYPRTLATGAAITWIAILSPAIVLTGSFCQVPQKAVGACSQLGELSYPIYAIHYPIFCWVNGVLQAYAAKSVVVDISTCLAFTLAGSWCVFVVFDRPARRWLRKQALSAT